MKRNFECNRCARKTQGKISCAFSRNKSDLLMFSITPIHAAADNVGCRGIFPAYYTSNNSCRIPFTYARNNENLCSQQSSAPSAPVHLEFCPPTSSPRNPSPCIAVTSSYIYTLIPTINNSDPVPYSRSPQCASSHPSLPPATPLNKTFHCSPNPHAPNTTT
jgi:hypothetical protein